jgi:hypothetical protein
VLPVRLLPVEACGKQALAFVASHPPLSFFTGESEEARSK